MSSTYTPEQGLRHNMSGLIALALASCLAVTTEMLPVGLLPAIGTAFGVAESTTGLLVSLYAVMVAVLAVPLTIATRTMPRKILLLVTVFGYVLSNTLVAVAPTFALIAAGRAVGGIAHALFFSLCIGYVPRLVGRDRVGKALALVTGGATAGFVLGVPFSTTLGALVGWRNAFFALAVLSALVLLAVAKLLPTVGSDGYQHDDVENRSARRRLAAVVSSNALTYVGHYMLYTYISVLFLAAGASESTIGPLLLVCGVCGLAGLWYSAKNLDRLPRRTTLVVLGVLVVAVVAVGISAQWLIPVVLAAAVWNGAFGGVASIYQASAVRTHALSPELAGAWVNAASNVGIAVGAALGGVLLADTGLYGVAWVGAGIVVLGLAVSIAGFGHNRRRRPASPDS